MEKDKENINPSFMLLITSLSQQAWQSLGKIPNPMTGKTNKNLEAAKLSIDILDMLKEKMKGNLTEEEERLLLATITDLQLNYVDEKKKEDQKKQ